MVFGKKKSAFARVSAPAASRERSRTVTPLRSVEGGAAQPPVEAGLPNMDAMLTLSVERLGQLGAGLCEAAGFPRESLGQQSDAVTWLCVRGLPGLTYMFKAIMDTFDLEMSERAPRPPEGGFTPVCPCPLTAAARLGSGFDDLDAARRASPDESQSLDMIVDNHPILMMPRLAEHAARLGVPVEIDVYPPHQGVEIERVERVCLHEGEMYFTTGDMSLLTRGARLRMRLGSVDALPDARLSTASQPRLDSQPVQAALVKLIEGARASKGLAPRVLNPTAEVRNLAAIRKPNPVPVVEAEAREFFGRIIRHNPALRGAFNALSEGERSNVVAMVYGRTEDGAEFGPVRLLTSRTSNPAAFYRECVKLGWMTDMSEDEIASMTRKIESPRQKADLAKTLAVFEPTKPGYTGLAVLLQG